MKREGASAEMGLKGKIRCTCRCLHLGISSYAEPQLFLCHYDMLLLWKIPICVCGVCFSNHVNAFIGVVTEQLRWNEDCLQWVQFSERQLKALLQASKLRWS